MIVYHGSHTKNWHSIIEQGLKNMSLTPMMSSGNLFGNGIYFSSKLICARGFAPFGKTWNKSRIGNRLQCVGICMFLFLL